MVASVLPASSLNVVVVMPLRDDWSSAAELIRRLDQAIASYPCALHVLLVDDGSAQGCNSADFQSDFAVVQTIQTLRLRRNLGLSEPSPLDLPTSTRPQRATPCW